MYYIGFEHQNQSAKNCFVHVIEVMFIFHNLYSLFYLPLDVFCEFLKKVMAVSTTKSFLPTETDHIGKLLIKSNACLSYTQCFKFIHTHQKMTNPPHIILLSKPISQSDHSDWYEYPPLQGKTHACKQNVARHKIMKHTHLCLITNMSTQKA